MSKECILNISVNKKKIIDKIKTNLEIQQKIVGAISTLPVTIGYDVIKTVDNISEDAKHVDISVNFIVSTYIIDDIYLIISHILHYSELPITIRVVNTAIFAGKFECQSLDIEVNRITFGLNENHDYFIHKDIESENCRRHMEKVRTWPEKWSSFMNEHKMHVFCLDCLHDKKHIQVRIPMIDEGDIIRMRERRRIREELQGRTTMFSRDVLQRNEPIGPNGDRNYFNEIIIKQIYDNIVKITIDIPKVDNDILYVTMYLHYRHCPSIFIRKIEERRNFYGKSYRYIDWSADFSIESFINEMVESNIMGIGIRCRRKEFTMLIYQLHDLIQCKLEFKKLIYYEKPQYLELPINIFMKWPFDIRYMVEAILSNGYAGKFLLLGSEYKMRAVINQIEELLMNRQHDLLYNNLMKKFFEIIQDSEIVDSITQKENHSRLKYSGDDSIEHIRKVIITPTRILLYPAEPILGSRIVRKVGADRVIRVVFRDDTMDSMRDMTCPPYIIAQTVEHFMKNGIQIAGEKYYFLGYSNSQLRDNGCYFLRTKDKNEVTNILLQMGTFKDEGVAKTMARFAQCFTQSRQSNINVDPGNCAEICDFESSARDSNGKIYCFSDGCGSISLKSAVKLMKETGSFDTSCFQFRKGGNKGVLAVDPILDKQQKWLNENGIKNLKNKLMKCDLLFRTSQNKFIANESDSTFELVKISQPVPVRLNKPLINIYDQVSMKQNVKTHERIKKRIHELATDHIVNVLRTLTEEYQFRSALSDVPVYAPINKMMSYSTLIDEPFFRSMVLARAKSSLKILNEKKQIAIPDDQGRCMFGIIDPYGILQYGQVFVQYSKNIYDQSKNRQKTILKGKVAISKNPMCNTGDLRMFDAVDIPALRHITDNVVFAVSGPRPHADEMAGSDYDGDEFSIIWDPELFIDYNEPAFNYTPPKNDIKSVPINELIDKSTDFFINYMSMDMIGQIANAHLMNSDLYGLESQVCQSIAKKQMIAVDFAKTGVPMKSLTRDWDEDGELPPERVERHPDFMQKDYAPTYESPRLLGELHRKISKFYDVITSVMNDVQEKPLIDPLIDYPGWEKYKDIVELQYNKYCTEFDHIMLAYGIVNEGEMFSQQFTVLKNRLNNRETDNMSGFTTTTLIQTQVFCIFTRYRTEFFEKFGHQFSSNDQKDIIRGSVVATSEMKRYAVAMYKVAYSLGIYISFPWTVWDVIDQIRSEKKLPIKIDPIGEHVSREIEKKKFNKYNIFKEKLVKIIPALDSYLERYQGLGQLLYFLMKWKEQQIYLDKINKPTLCLIFVKFGLGLLPNPKGYFPFLEMTDKDNQDKIINLKEDIGGLGRKLIWFFASIGSNEFAELQEFNFLTPNLGPNGSVYDHESFLCLHEAGLFSFLNICCRIYPDVLLPFNRDGSSQKNNSQIIKPANPFIVEIPLEMQFGFLQAIPKIEEKSGCQQVEYHVQEQPFYSEKRMTQNPNVKITLWPKGTPNQISKLRNMLTVRPELNKNEKPRDTSKRIGQMVMERVQQIIQDTKS